MPWPAGTGSPTRSWPRPWSPSRTPPGSPSCTPRSPWRSSGCAGRLDGSLEELAHHACEGASAGTARQAFTYSLAAAEASHEARASGDEAEHLRRALAVQSTTDPGAAGQRVELLIRMGMARRDPATCWPAATRSSTPRSAAEELGDRDSVAAALAALSPIDLWAAIDWSLSDARAVALIERVLAQEPAEPTPAGTAVRADLSAEIVYVEPARADALSAQAVSELEAHGDAELSQRVLLMRYWAISSPNAWEERQEISDRLVELAESGVLPASFTPLAHLAETASTFQCGDIDAVDAAVAAARETAHPARTPIVWMHLLWTEVSLAMLRGELDRALVQTEELGIASWRVRRFTAEFTRAAMRSSVLAEQGRIDEALKAFEPLNHPPYDQSSQWLLAWFLASNGRDQDAIDALGRWDGPVPDDWLTLALLTAGVLAAATVGEVGFLRRHLPSLEPLSGYLAIAGNGGPFYGPGITPSPWPWKPSATATRARQYAAQAAAQTERIGAVRLAARGCGRCRPASTEQSAQGFDGDRVGLGEDVVDQAVGHGVGPAEDEVAVDVGGDLLDGLAGVLGQRPGHPLAQQHHLLHRQLDVGGLALGAAVGLVDEHPGVGQGEPLAPGAAGQDHRGRRRGLADAVGGHVAAQQLHGVVDGEQRGHVAAGGVDVEPDVLARVLGLEVQELGDDQVGDRVVERRAEEHQALLQQAGPDVEGPLAAAVCSMTVGTSRLMGLLGSGRGHRRCATGCCECRTAAGSQPPGCGSAVGGAGWGPRPEAPVDPLTITRSVRIDAGPTPCGPRWATPTASRAGSAPRSTLDLAPGAAGSFVDARRHPPRLVVTEVDEGRHVGFVWWDDARPDDASTCASTWAAPTARARSTVTVTETLDPARARPPAVRAAASARRRRGRRPAGARRALGRAPRRPAGRGRRPPRPVGG